MKMATPIQRLPSGGGDSIAHSVYFQYGGCYLMDRVLLRGAFNRGAKMDIKWKEGSTIKTKEDNGVIVISANKEGMLSLAAQLTDLASQPPGNHIHYDEYNSLEDGSAEMIIVKIP